MAVHIHGTPADADAPGTASGSALGALVLAVHIPRRLLILHCPVPCKRVGWRLSVVQGLLPSHPSPSPTEMQILWESGLEDHSHGLNLDMPIPRPAHRKVQYLPGTEVQASHQSSSRSHIMTLELLRSRCMQIVTAHCQSGFPHVKVFSSMLDLQGQNLVNGRSFDATDSHFSQFM